MIHFPSFALLAKTDAIEDLSEVFVVELAICVAEEETKLTNDDYRKINEKKKKNATVAFFFFS